MPIRRFNQGPVEVGATPPPCMTCPEGGVKGKSCKRNALRWKEQLCASSKQTVEGKDYDIGVKL